MKIKGKSIRFYGSNATDRVWLSMGTIAIVWFGCLLVVSRTTTEIMWALAGVCVSLCTIAMGYLFQAPPDASEGTDYTRMIAQVDQTKTALQSLTSFLERERRRVNQVQETVGRLEAESTALEPVVTAKREIVEAILKQHASTLRSHAWKDRLVGFVIGLLSSLVASGILYACGVGR